ncbi:hypothetical protein BOVA713_1501 [Bacteroides ovatus]|uniref:Uncharacterized protein n=1 Tax=Bacteroides ovatus (strain ATCC 8483 / DSM 1896 / JCM 5824 / BCRC 10623 / CCUG 4943 / NCTC 11153) TaxID=411476 RepID=A0AAN3DA67_BACO1|nr:hypothetical protein BACOVA_00347 [Bacteroides ovatus ATCC 8483]CAG9893757.1 hypothetical protein BOVA713_1501 [Bacteroides ovatus]
MNTVMKSPPFTRKQFIHREFRRKVKRIEKIAICRGSVEYLLFPL